MKLLISIIALFYSLTTSTVWAIDIAVQYHVNTAISSCPSSDPTNDWYQWVNTGEVTGRNPCTFLGGTSWLRQTTLTIYPLIGLYAGSSTEVTRWHMRVAKAAGIKAFLVSVFPGVGASEHTTYKNRFLEILRIAHEEGFHVGLEMWQPVGSTTNANFYSRAQAMIDAALASSYASALYRVNNLPVVWFVWWSQFDTESNIASNLINTRQVYWIISGMSTTNLNNITVTNSSVITGVATNFNPSSSGCVAHNDISDTMAAFAASGYTRVSHTYPRFNNGNEFATENVCLTGPTNTQLTSWYNESVAGSAVVALIESWNDFREMTALEPGITLLPTVDVGQEEIYFGDPYYTLRKLASLQGITFAEPTIPCAIVESVMIDAPGFPGCDGRKQAIPRAPSSLRVQAQ